MEYFFSFILFMYIKKMKKKRKKVEGNLKTWKIEWNLIHIINIFSHFTLPNLLIFQLIAVAFLAHYWKSSAKDELSIITMGRRFYIPPA